MSISKMYPQEPYYYPSSYATETNRNELTGINGILIFGGLAGIVSSIITKKEPWATLGVVGGVIMLGAGIVNVSGILTKL